MAKERERHTQRNRPHRVTDARRSSSHRAPLLIAAGLAVVGATALKFSRTSPDAGISTPTPHTSPTLPHPITQTPNVPFAQNELGMLTDEAQIDVLIAKLDQGFLNTHALLSQKLAGADPKKRDYILAPLEFYLQNIDHDRNYIRANKALQSVPDVSVPLSQTTVDIGASNFYINGISGDSVADAVFSPGESTLFMPPTYDPQSMYAVAMGIHESFHARDHFARMQQQDTPQQVNYLNFVLNWPPDASIVTNEVNAYAHQLHVIDTLTDGALSADVKSGVADMRVWRNRLNSPPNRDQMLENLIQMASYLFPNQATIDEIPKEFEDVLHQFHSDMGKTLYEFDENGMVVPVDR